MKKLREEKLCTADEAVAAIADGSTIATGGFVGAAHAEALTAALERRFLSSGNPTGLTLVYAAGQGDGSSRGLNHLAHEGLVSRVIGGHWGLAPAMGKLAIENKIEAWNFPQGVICHLFRDIAAGNPGTLTRIGLDTFVDPIHEGGKINSQTTEDLVERVEISGRPWLLYRAFPVQVGLIRATAADPRGNLSMGEEVISGEVLAIAQAVRNSGGIVIAQVRHLLNEAIPPHQVEVPNILVDRIVHIEDDEHDQTFATKLNPAFVSPPDSTQQAFSPLPPGPRRIIASRAAEELQPGDIANLGIGMPEGVGAIAAERGFLDRLTLTIESGPIGGVPAGGLDFGASFHPDAIVDQPAQFDFYNGGGLDFAALGAAQIDQRGNVNVSRFGNRLAGAGGFINITQTAKRIVFCGTFTTGGLETVFENGQLRILKEGKNKKFVEAVQQITFSGPLAVESKCPVLFVTERAVFRLVPDGLELIEIAPGIDLESQVLALMDFRPILSDVRPMELQHFEI
ncbi:MAG: acyl CoA:acetate/3-ketoacid CoA transferase [Chthoniobacterales bacterium]